jgi:hypothetical protein
MDLMGVSMGTSGKIEFALKSTRLLRSSHHIRSCGEGREHLTNEDRQVDCALSIETATPAAYR